MGPLRECMVTPRESLTHNSLNYEDVKFVVIPFSRLQKQTVCLSLRLRGKRPIKPRNLGITSFKDICRQCVPRIRISGPRADVARREREVYRETLKEAAHEMSSHVRAIGPVPVLSCSEVVHFTFDYSQNVTIPHHRRQMGPMYPAQSKHSV
ncbi:hypothetical protein MAR_013195, partial [Mya arenaria]